MRGNEHARRGNGGASPSNAPVITEDECAAAGSTFDSVEGN